jgi:hypothetical protein
MRQPIPLRLDYDAALLRQLARESKDPDQVRDLRLDTVLRQSASKVPCAMPMSL